MCGWWRRYGRVAGGPEPAGAGDRPFDYVLGCRMRRNRELAEHVLPDTGAYESVGANLEVKEVRVGPRR